MQYNNLSNAIDANSKTIEIRLLNTGFDSRRWSWYRGNRKSCDGKIHNVININMWISRSITSVTCSLVYDENRYPEKRRRRSDFETHSPRTAHISRFGSTNLENRSWNYSHDSRTLCECSCEIQNTSTKKHDNVFGANSNSHRIRLVSSDHSF